MCRPGITAKYNYQLHGATHKRHPRQLLRMEYEQQTDHLLLVRNLKSFDAASDE
jgi:hypothetical protein